VLAHLRAAFAFNVIGATGQSVAFQLTGPGADVVSQLYRLVVAWSVPAVVQQARWIVFDLPARWNALTAELREIVNANDEGLLAKLKPYIGRQAAAANWLRSLWHPALNQK
jgi:hypothetical protein